MGREKETVLSEFSLRDTHMIFEYTSENFSQQHKL